LFQDHDRFSGGIAFLILIFISVALWAWLIFSFAWRSEDRSRRYGSRRHLEPDHCAPVPMGRCSSRQGV